MRYANRTQSPSYCGEAGCMLNPGSTSAEVNFLRDALRRASARLGNLGVVLSDEERGIIGRLLASDAECRSPMPATPAPPSPRSSGRPGVDGYNPAYDEQDLIRKAKAERDRQIAREHAERQSRINSESVYFGPDGRPVEERTGLEHARFADKVVPREVKDPMSALDILSHNAAVTRIRAEDALTGSAAVAGRNPVPGMPNIPGTESMKGGEPINASYKVARTDEILAKAEEGNYGRK